MKKLKAALLIIEQILAVLFVLLPALFISGLNYLFTLEFRFPDWMHSTWIGDKADQWLESIEERNSKI